MNEIRYLDVSGAPFECGRAHGRALAREIAENLETYLRRFAQSGLGRDAALAEGRRWSDAIAAEAPHYAEEMRGIAAGSEQPDAAIAMLNARYEIAFTLSGQDARATDGCTTFGALAEATAGHVTLLGQNWDWLEGIAGRAVVLRQSQPGKPRLLCLTEAGIAGGKMGVNELGIGLVENGLASPDDGKHAYRKPFHVRCREILEADAFDGALLPVMRTLRTASANFMIGQAQGEIIDLETSPDHVAPLYPKDGIVTHSNHFLDPRHGASLLERLGPSTLFRAARLERLLREGGGVDLMAVKAALADHFSHPNSICRHPDPRQPQATRMQTVASVILELDQRIMHVANGPPCENPYRAFALEGELRAVA